MSEQYEEEKKEEDKEEEKAQDMDPGAMLESILAKLDEVLSLLGGKEEPEEAPTEEGPAEMAAATASAESMAKLSALESVVKKLTAEKEAEKITRAAMRDLNGYALADGVEDQIRQVAVDSGITGVNHYVATIRQYAPKEPTDSLESDEFAGLPDEVMEYQSKGPQSFEKAIGHYREFEALRGRTRLSLKSFLDAQFTMARGVK